MIKSMTAFARVEQQSEQGELVWEIRSVNHRYLETFIRLPEEFRSLEPKIREAIASRLKRGKIEAALRFHSAGKEAKSVVVNAALVKELNKALREVSILIPDVKSPSAMDVLEWPGIIEAEEKDSTQLFELAMELLGKTLQQLVDARESEGEKLKSMIVDRIDLCASEVEKARVRMPEVIEGLRVRIRERFEEFKEQLDPVRLEQEMAIIVQRLDVRIVGDILNNSWMKRGKIANLGHCLRKRRFAG